MAENEYLDSTKARRWQAVAEAVRNRRQVEEVTELVLDRFYKTLRSIAKDLPFANWVDAVENPTELRRLSQGVKGGLDVKDLLLRAAVEAKGRENVLERFLNDGLQNCLYDIPYLAADLKGGANISEGRRILKEARSRLSPEIHRIAGKLSENSSWLPRRKGGPSDNSGQDHTTTMLTESLIAGFKK
jgi:hypothetical protein